MKIEKLKNPVTAALILFLFSFLTVKSQETSGENVPGQSEKRDVHKLTGTLEKIAGVYSYDWKQLEKSRSEVDKLRRKAEGAKASRVGVALFGELSGIILRYFNASGPDGLLQDVFQEALFDTGAKPEEKERFQSWMGRNFRRRKELKKTYELLVQALRAPLDEKPGPYLEKINRRLNNIVRISDELSRQIGESMEQLETDREAVEKLIRLLRSGTPSAETPEGN